MVIVDATENTRYAFVAVDATLDLGPKRILNFGISNITSIFNRLFFNITYLYLSNLKIVGDLNDLKMAQLERLKWSVTQSKVNASIWFGHYPSSSIHSTGSGFREIAAQSIAYLCGHFHTLFDIVPQMYARHHSGLLELELADWKKKRMQVYFYLYDFVLRSER